MRTIERSNTFKRDFKRELKGRYKKALDSELSYIIQGLMQDEMLEIQYKNHALSGSWNGYWECHIKPDLLLIYKKIEADVLLLARLGSHSELFKG
jgi:mRNA interferase YafQ